MKAKADSTEGEKNIGQHDQRFEMDFKGIKKIIDGVEEDRKTLLEDEAREVLGKAGIPIAEGCVVDSIEDCVNRAEEIGYPVVLKVVSEDIMHKMDVGGIAVGLEDEKEVVEAYESIRSHVKSRKPDAKIRGISVSEMIDDKEEVVIGGMIDPSFGPVVMFGLGGIYVEILEDVVFRVAPLSFREACDMIGDIKTYSILIGARGKKKRDIDALAEMIARIGDLIYNVDEINDIDLNPVAAMEDGAKALDVAITLK